MAPASADDGAGRYEWVERLFDQSSPDAAQLVARVLYHEQPASPANADAAS